MKTNNKQEDYVNNTMVISINGKSGVISEETERAIKRILYELSDEYNELDISLTTDNYSELISRNF